MSMTEFIACFTGSGCLGFVDLPSGGGILATIAVAVLVLSQARVRDTLTSIIGFSPQGLAALMIGAGAYLYDDRPLPFLVALITALVCYLLAWQPVGQGLATRIEHLPRPAPLKQTPAPWVALITGALLYALAQTAYWTADWFLEQRSAKTESEVLVAVALPARIDHSLLYDQHKDVLDSANASLYQELHSLLHISLDHLGPKLELLPKALPHNPEERAKTIARHDALRRRPGDLVTYRDPTLSPIDLVIEPFFAHTWVGHGIRTNNYGMRIRQFDRVQGRLESWPGAREIEWIHARGVWDDHRLAALLSIAKAAVISADRNLHRDRLSQDERAATWRALIDAFRDYYNRNLARLNRDRPENWGGHALAADQGCVGKACVERWIAAHSATLEDKQAKAAMEREADRQVSVILQSARDGGAGQ